MSESKKIDLHVHTTYSDGYLSPQKIVQEIKKNQLDVVSITDHDNIEGLKKVKSLSPNINIINGIELSTKIKVNKKNYHPHVLGYGFDINNEELLYTIEKMKLLRTKYYLEYLNKLKVELKELFPTKIVEKINLNKYCFIDKIILDNLNTDNYSTKEIKIIRKALYKYPFRISNEYRIEFEEAIDLIHQAGGYASLAHPEKSIENRSDLKQVLDVGKIKSLDGIEVLLYGMPEKDKQFYHKLLREYNLKTTIGSDFHINIGNRKKIIGIKEGIELQAKDATLLNEIMCRELKRERVI